MSTKPDIVLSSIWKLCLYAYCPYYFLPDTTEHSILLNFFQQDFGVVRTALNWFVRLILSGRIQRILIGDETSDDFILNCRVPQGSYMGPFFLSGFENVLLYPYWARRRLYRSTCHLTSGQVSTTEAFFYFLISYNKWHVIVERRKINGCIHIFGSTKKPNWSCSKRLFC